MEGAGICRYVLYPDYLGGGLETYYIGANLLAHILPENEKQPLLKVEIAPPNGQEYEITKGIYATDAVIAGIQRAMVLGSLLGYGDGSLSGLMKNKTFKADEILYVGLRELHDYQEKFLKEMNIAYKVQTEEFVSDSELKKFMCRFGHILVHLDIDVLDANSFHSTYFAHKTWIGTEVDLCASVEPSGIQIAGTMPDDIWKEWYCSLKQKLTIALGYEIGEPEEGYDFKYYE